MKKLLCVSHLPGEDAGSLGPAFEEQGYRIDHYRGQEDPLRGMDPAQHDIALFMGGAMGVYEREEHPWINTALSYLEKRLAMGLPTLGVCLGAQMIAQALGSTVYRGEAGREIGWKPLILTEDGKKSVVRFWDPSCTMMMHWHGDTFPLPAGASLLASSEKYEMQAFSYGKTCLGLQFHPEVTPPILEKWIDDDVRGEIPQHCGSVDHYRVQCAQYSAALQRQTRLFVAAWLDGLGE